MLKAMIWDDGNGGLYRAKGGRGTINYSTGQMQMRGLPADTEISAICVSDSALGGESTTLGAGEGTSLSNLLGTLTY